MYPPPHMTCILLLIYIGDVRAQRGHSRQGGQLARDIRHRPHVQITIPGPRLCQPRQP